MIYRISSRTNPRVKELIKNKDRYFFFEGEKLVKNLLEKKMDIRVLMVSEKREHEAMVPRDARVNETWIAAETVLEKVSALKEKPQFLAVVEYREKPIEFRGTPVVIGLDNIQDPANVGTVFRCAAAFGISSIALSGSSVNLNNSKFLRAAQQAFLEIRWQRFQTLEELIRAAEEAELKIYLTSSHETGKIVTPGRIERPCLIVFGNEGKGLEKALWEKYPAVKIPQEEKVESLNVGVSACIIMYEVGLASGALE